MSINHKLLAYVGGNNEFTEVNTFNGIKLNVVVKSANYTLMDNDNVVVFTATATAKLPFATGTGQHYSIKNISTGTITITGTASDTIDGETSQTLSQWDDIQVVDYIANKWIII